MTPWFSLILPCYNVEKYVDRCVQSILVQDFNDYEIILVDDGSTDQTPEICDTLAKKHSCIRVIHKENGDPSSARNAGLDVARGRYIWFVDSDDWIEPDALACLCRAGKEYGPDVLKFNYKRIESVEYEVISSVKPGLHTGIALEKIRQMTYRAQGKYGMSGCMHVYKRALLEEYHIRFVSERKIGSEDVLFTMQVLFHAQSLYMLSQPFYNYERRNGSLSQTYAPDLAERYVAFRDYLLSYFRVHSASIQTECLLERFFLWHLIVGSCVTQEYFRVVQPRTMLDARKKVRELLAMKVVQNAARKSDKEGLTWGKKLQLLAIRMRAEPLFYWLFVVKPARNTNRKRKGKE